MPTYIEKEKRMCRAYQPFSDVARDKFTDGLISIAYKFKPKDIRSAKLVNKLDQIINDATEAVLLDIKKAYNLNAESRAGKNATESLERFYSRILAAYEYVKSEIDNEYFFEMYLTRSRFARLILRSLKNNMSSVGVFSIAERERYIKELKQDPDFAPYDGDDIYEVYFDMLFNIRKSDGRRMSDRFRAIQLEEEIAELKKEVVRAERNADNASVANQILRNNDRKVREFEKKLREKDARISAKEVALERKIFELNMRELDLNEREAKLKEEQTRFFQEVYKANKAGLIDTAKFINFGSSNK